MFDGSHDWVTQLIESQSVSPRVLSLSKFFDSNWGEYIWKASVVEGTAIDFYFLFILPVCQWYT